ncbi:MULTISPECIES: hypothetical protein [unclassified Crossiella]|uniref:hypothetical protein n=1 Tax=unclassified Crossiella TaxID=2620835 RepID=UPI00200035DF|nr:MULTISPECIES: hypothetical protein [unclassified Crossiella]MCK2243162.1 hypothetical protein [Crossiella sp. S99.2]MCK2254369.1 hypothetical protein [Crossiella sp. S99.1]
MNARRVAYILTAVLAVYLVLLAERAYTLVTSGTAVAFILGLAILILPILGAWMVLAELRFGSRTEALARRLDEAGELPDISDLPRRPSGRVERDAADAWFAERKAEVDAAPADWRGWFKLAQAYDIAGDRRRAREAMRKAIELGNT